MVVSPPTRVVWIEIAGESVADIADKQSPPTRVVWIEMETTLCNCGVVSCHHPHGWCGLKLYCRYLLSYDSTSPPTRVVWIEIFGYWALDTEGVVTTHTGGVD